MEKNEISERMRALRTASDKRSETARLREVFDDIEATLKAGVSQATVLNELHDLGFTLKMASFKSALQRIRKERNIPTKSALKRTHDSIATLDKTSIKEPQTGSPEGNPTRITNPADIRKVRNREIDLDDLND